MKKRIFKSIYVLLVVCLLLPVGALVGCTDKEPKERVLTEYEQMLVGEWRYLTFYSDGTCTDKSSSSKQFEFRQVGRGYHAEFGNYTKFKVGTGYLYLFDDYPDALYYVNDDISNLHKLDIPYDRRITD